MEQQTQYVFNSASAEATEQFAESIGQQLRGGEILQLIGDVGAGKTTFVRGLVQGIGSTDRVSSPTFTVSNVYDSEKLSVHHYDFYRINDVAIMQEELSEVIVDPRNVAVLEWAEAITNVLPTEHMIIRFRVSDENTRMLTCSIPEQYAYMGFSK